MPSEIKSPGGVAFELVWEPPSKDPAKVLNSPPHKEIDPEKLKEKLQAAEERRQGPSEDPAKVLNSPPHERIDPKKPKEKLQAAEERRQAMLIESRKSAGKEVAEKIKKAQAKVAELDNKFKEEAKINLTEKLSKVETNKEISERNLKLRLEKSKEQREKAKQRKKENVDIGENGDASAGPC